jgi:hypothetical protein
MIYDLKICVDDTPSVDGASPLAAALIQARLFLAICSQHQLTFLTVSPGRLDLLKELSLCR